MQGQPGKVGFLGRSQVYTGDVGLHVRSRMVLWTESRHRSQLVTPRPHSSETWFVSHSKGSDKDGYGNS